MSFTKTVFICPAGELAITAADSKAAGRIALLKDGAFVSGATPAAIADGSDYQFLAVRNVQTGTDLTQTTPIFQKQDVKKVSVKQYAAGTAGNALVTLAGANPYIKLIDITDGREKFAMVTFEGTAPVLDDAGNEIATAITLLGQKTQNQFTGVSASYNTGTNVMTVTFPLNRLLKFVANDESTLGAVTAPVYSVGTIPAVLADEKSALPYAGVTNIAGPNTKIPPSTVVTNLTYNKYTIMLEKQVGARLDTHEVVIYQDSVDTGFDTWMESFFGVTLIA